MAQEELKVCGSRLSRAQADLKSQEEARQEQQESSSRLKEKLSRLEVSSASPPALAKAADPPNPPHHYHLSQAQLQSNATESSEAELALHAEARSLRSELEEARRRTSRAEREQRELSARLEEEEKDKEALKQSNVQMEEVKRQQERALEKLSKEVRRRKEGDGKIRSNTRTETFGYRIVRFMVWLLINAEKMLKDPVFLFCSRPR